MRVALVQGHVHFSAHPQVMQQHRKFAGRRPDNLGAYSASRPETGLLIPSDYNSYFRTAVVRPESPVLAEGSLDFPKRCINFHIDSVILEMLGVRRLEDQVLAMLRGQLADIILGTIFSFMGLAVCSIAGIRRRSGVRLLIWLGIWSAMYGSGLLIQSRAVVATLPHSIQSTIPFVNIVRSYLTVVVGLSAFLELSLGKVRLFIETLILAGMAVALAGIGWFVFGGSGEKFMPYNTLVAVGGLLVLVPVVALRKLSDRFMVLLNRRVLAAGTLVFAIEALWVNLSRPLNLQTPRLLDHLAFAMFLLSFGYVGVQVISANERRLRSNENELEVAVSCNPRSSPPAFPKSGTCGLQLPIVL